MRLEQRKSPRLETRVGNKGLIAISKPPFLRVVMINFPSVLREKRLRPQRFLIRHHQGADYPLEEL